MCRCCRLRSRLVHVSSGLHMVSHDGYMSVKLMPPAGLVVSQRLYCQARKESYGRQYGSIRKQSGAQENWTKNQYWDQSSSNKVKSQKASH